MAMIHQKDKPTYYNIVGVKSGTVFATASASKVLKLHKKLQEEYNGEKLEMVLITEKE